MKKSSTDWKISEYLQSGNQIELIASTHTSCKDQYSDMDSSEEYTVLKPYTVMSIEA